MIYGSFHFPQNANISALFFGRYIFEHISSGVLKFLRYLFLYKTNSVKPKTSIRRNMNKFVKTFCLLLGLVFILVLVFFGLEGCKSGSSGAGVLIVIKGTQVKTFSVAQIRALPVLSGSTGDVTSSGTIEGPYQYKGAALTDILKAIGGITTDNAVRISAKDGYSMTMSYKQVAQGSEFPTYDKTTGKEVTPASPLTVFIAYEKDQKPIDDTLGPLRLGIMAPDQVTDGHWWVKWAQKIEVITVQQAWTISLQGAITQSMDKATFESGAAPGCHGTTWTDAQGHSWLGIPLWYLVGNVDDATDMAYNDALADQGYEVHVANSNGDMVTFSSKEVKRNNNIIVAYQIDGQPLPSTKWPLALVGSGVDPQHQIAQISKIKLVFPSSTNK